MEPAVIQLKEMVASSDNIVFFGGAGVSTESGIPDFRSVDGLYHQKFRYPPETILSHTFYERHKEEFFDFYRQKLIAPEARPNAAHVKLAQWERDGKLKAVITQNIDGLHQMAGSHEVLELHGSVLRNYCERCGKFYGVELGKSSVEKILHPEAVDFSLLAVGILVASIAVKLYMYLYNRRIGRRISSAAMEATATDSLSDAIATTAVLAAMLVGRFTSLMIDGWVGLVVACFILFSGYQAAKETLGPLLGQPPEQELVERIQQMVLSHPPICGIHDLVVHDYGPGRMMVSLHAEVPAHGDILELHDVIDTAEMELKRTLHCDAVIHMDPIITDDAQIVQLRRRVAELVRQVDSGMTIHDFRVVPGPSHTNLIFDAVLPFGEHITEAEAARQIRERVRQMDGGEYYAVVTVENPYV